LGDQQITALLQALAGFEVLGTDANLILDALIAEAAIRSRCSLLFSEDFSHGRRIAGLEVVNPLLG
jgi:predicted nucleic acid-binding protein